MNAFPYSSAVLVCFRRPRPVPSPMREDEVPVEAHSDVGQIKCNYPAEEMILSANHESLVGPKVIQSNVQDMSIENFVLENRRIWNWTSTINSLFSKHDDVR